MPTSQPLQVRVGEVPAAGRGRKTKDRFDVGAITAVIRPRVPGGIILVDENHLVRIDEAGVRPSLPDVLDDPSVRKEGGCDPGVAFYCGTMAYDQAPGRGLLMRFAADASSEVVREEVFGPVLSTWSSRNEDEAGALANDTPYGLAGAVEYCGGPSDAIARVTVFLEILNCRAICACGTFSLTCNLRIKAPSSKVIASPSWVGAHFSSVTSA